MRKGSAVKAPSEKEINRLSNHLRHLDFLYYISFADTLIRYIEITIRKTGLSRLQGQVLHYIILNKGVITPTYLSKIMFRSKHSMTKIIDSLEKEGLIFRDYTNKDRRITYIKITSSGLDYVKMTTKEANQWRKKALYSMEAEERKYLIKLTEKLRKRIAEIINQL